MTFKKSSTSIPLLGQKRGSKIRCGTAQHVSDRQPSARTTAVSLFRHLLLKITPRVRIIALSVLASAYINQFEVMSRVITSDVAALKQHVALFFLLVNHL